MHHVRWFRSLPGRMPDQRKFRLAGEAIIMKKALITGITGQDGSYLAEFLLNKGYEVHGLIRRASTFNTSRVEHIYVDPHAKGARFFLHYGDLASGGQLTNLIYDIQPDETYNLGAQSHVRVSFDMPEYTGDVTALGTTRLLEAIKRSGHNTKFYQASSSEMFGATGPPQNETSPFYPRSPYAAAKLYSYWMTVNYREGYDMFACNGILFNHESPRRGETFVTRKITMAVANIVAGKQGKLFLGNLEARRDWGFAPEYVVCQWLMLQQDSPRDYAIGYGENHSVREFAERSFSCAGVELEWKGKGVETKGVVKSSSHDTVKPGDVVIEVDTKYFRPTEVNTLLADSSRVRNDLGWEPKVSFDELVSIMVEADMEKAGLETSGKAGEILSRTGIDWLSGKM